MSLDDKEHYYKEDYDYAERFIAYFEQIRLTRKYAKKDSKLLEVGIGNKTLFNYLKQHGYNIQSLDIVKELEPDYCLDISKELPFKDKAFDIVLCFQTLEHMSFDNSISALLNMQRIAEYVVISIPYRNIVVGGSIKVPFFQKKDIYIRIPHFLDRKIKGSHEWEMGDKGYSRKEIRQKLINLNFRIIEEYVNPSSPYKYFFVLKT